MKFDIIDSIRKQRLYRRTVNELRSLSPAIASDIGIDSGNLKKVARQTVWGNQ